MSKKRKLHDLREKASLDMIESKLTERLAEGDNAGAYGGYLSHYDASLLNKGVVRTPKEDSNNK